MQLVGYNFEEDVICAIEEYERDKNPSLNGMVEEFIKGVLYDSGYYRKEIPEEEIFTPKELNKIDKFSKHKWGNDGKVQIKYDDLSFGSFKEEIADEIIFKLARLPDEELIKYSKTYCGNTLNYTNNDYQDFMLEWLCDDSMFPEERSLLKRREYPSTNRVEFFYRKDILAAFNKKKYTPEKINEVELFLNEFSPLQLQKISEMRQNAGMTSDKFMLNLMRNPQEIEIIMEGK